MPKIHLISTVYCEPDLFALGLARLLRTAGKLPDTYTFVNHHWPIGEEQSQKINEQIARIVDGRVIDPGKNLGGHGGWSWGLEQTPAEPDDLMLFYDPDTYHETPGWLQAMYDVMVADKSRALVVTWPPPSNTIVQDWKEEPIAGHRCAFFPRAEMFSATLFRKSFIGNELKADSEYYGYIEWPQFHKAQRMGLRHAYLLDFKEANNPVPHNRDYVRWKRQQVAHSFTGNFDQWLKEKK